MLSKNTRKLIIVCDEKTEVYANYLRQLISVNDDKDGEVVGTEDGTVDAAVWLEKEYLANKPQISSNEHILFVGKNKTSKSEATSMTIRFNEHGMKYGWLGKRGILIVDDGALSPEEYDSFLEFALGYQTEFEKISMKRFSGSSSKSQDSKDNREDVNENKSPRNLKNGVAAAVAAGAIAVQPIRGIAGGVALGVAAGVNKVQTHKKVKDQQYRALAVVFYIDALSDFLEG